VGSGGIAPRILNVDTRLRYFNSGWQISLLFDDTIPTAEVM